LNDPRPEEPLDLILPISVRAMSLIARRHAKPILAEAFIQIHGAAVVMDGLDYHYGRYMDAIRFLQSPRSSSETNFAESNLNHEAVAYVGRLGQFYYFVKSDLVRRAIPNAIRAIQKIDELVVFRMKHSAHRSVDIPRPEDTPHLQTVHAMCLSPLGGKVFQPKEPCFSTELHALYAKCYRVHQLNMGEAGHWGLCLEWDHSAVMAEAYSILESLLH
jgi:hypothetical protein